MLRAQGNRQDAKNAKKDKVNTFEVGEFFNDIAGDHDHGVRGARVAAIG